MSEGRVYWSLSGCNIDSWTCANGMVTFLRRRWLLSAAMFDRMLTMDARRKGAKFRRARKWPPRPSRRKNTAREAHSLGFSA